MAYACLFPLLILSSSCLLPAVCLTPERDLAKWLKNLTLRVPTTSVTRHVFLLGTINLTVSDLACQGFSVGDLAVAEQGLSSTSRKLQFTLETAAVNSCVGHWAVGKSSELLVEAGSNLTLRPSENASSGVNLAASSLQDMAGSFSFSISELSISLPLLFDGSDTSQEAISMLPKGCKTALRMRDLRFNGKMRLLKAVFSHLLQWIINSYVDHFGCRLPAKGLAELNDLVRPLTRLPKVPHPVPAVLPSNASSAHLVNWSSDVVLLRDLPDAQKAASMLRSAIQRLSQGTDELSQQIPSGFLRPLIEQNRSRELGLSIVANLTNFTVSGLGSVTECQPIGTAVGDPHSLRAHCAFKRLNVSLSFALELTPVDDMETATCQAQAPFLTHVSMNSSFEGISMEIQALLAADYSRLQRITLDGILFSTAFPQEVSLKQAAGTIAAAVYEANITELNFRIADIKSVVLTQDGGKLSSLLAASADNFLQAFLGIPRFQNILPNVLDSEAWPKIRHTLNRQILQSFSDWTPYADPDGGVMKPRATKGIDPDGIRLMGLIAFGAFLPVCLIIYFSAWHHVKHSRLHQETFSGWSTSPDGSIAGRRAYRSLSDDCSTFMRYILPLCLASNMAVALFSILVPLCDVRMRMMGGLLDPKRMMADDSLIVYSFFQMVSDFWQSGATIIASLMVSGGLVLPFLCGSMSLLAFGFPMPSKLRERWCVAHLIVIRMLFVNEAFICLVIVQLRMQLAISGASMSMVAEPIYGLITATLGTLLALGTATLLLYLHHTTSADARPRCDRDALLQSGSFSVSRKISVPALFCSLAACSSLVGAWTHELISFTTTGLAGIAASSEFSDLSNPRSVWLGSLPADLYSLTDVHGSAFLIAGLLFLVTILGPAVCCLLWLVQWTFACVSRENPRCSRFRFVRYAAKTSPYLLGLYCMDVMWMAAAAGWLEMDLSVQFIVMHKAGDMCSLLKEAINEPCIHVEGKLHAGSWWLLASICLSFALYVLSARTFGFRAA